jgi:hypothetical protein
MRRLIESLGLSAGELRRYLDAEIGEFLEATDPAAKREEFGDMLFALLSMSWAHAGQHFELDAATFEGKIKQRLRTHAAVTRYPRKYRHDRIRDMRFGVLHVAFGQFAGNWKAFDPLKNGTVAEISMLTDAPFGQPNRYTNHCILTFDDTPCLEYELIGDASDVDGGNTVRCRIPDFLYTKAKAELAFQDSAEYLALQVLAALDGVQIEPHGFVHFHSWEGGFLTDCAAFLDFLGGRHTLFSPYLTIGPLQSFIEHAGKADWTMTREELAVAACYEARLAALADRVILESERDRVWYDRQPYEATLDVRSFARKRTASFPTDPQDETRLTFVAGGRPVREKGFIELCHQFALVRDWAAPRGIDVSLAIICRDARPGKGAAYVKEIEQAIAAHGMQTQVEILPRMSLDALRRRLSEASALIVPSLHDPFCLMPTYGLDVATPAFVSKHAGVSENVASDTFVFDPLVPGDLARAVDAWYRERPVFRYESRFPSYSSVYLQPGVR